MARHYYERYTVRSSTTYRWDRYYADPVYDYPAYANSTNMGTPENFSGYSSVTFNTRTGTFTNGSPKTITPGSSGVAYVAVGNMAYKYQFDSREGYIILWQSSTTSYKTLYYQQGDFVSTTYDSYSAYTNNARNADGCWYVRGSSSTSYYRGTYIDTIVAEDGTYPDNGRVGTSYWYVKTGKAFPEFKVRQNGQLKTSVDGWVRVNGVLKQIQQIWIRANGQLKEV